MLQVNALKIEKITFALFMTAKYRWQQKIQKCTCRELLVRLLTLYTLHNMYGRQFQFRA